MPLREEVAVTGIGIISPLGSHKEEVWYALLQGENGIKPLPDAYKAFHNYGIHVLALAPQLKPENFKTVSDKKRNKLKTADNKVIMLLHSVLEAIKDADLDIPDHELGMILGTAPNTFVQYKGLDTSERAPSWFFDTYPSAAMGRVADIISLKGYANVIVNACCSGMQAIGEGFRKIRNKEETLLLVGGVDDKVNEVCAEGFSRLGMASQSIDAERASIPFDRSRNGFVIGQGACMLVIESLSHAKLRNAKILGKIAGYGAAIDSTSIADASADGKIRAMERALSDAQIGYDKIGYINAHGTSTISNDKEESNAILQVFKDRAKDIPVSSTKSLMGHTFAACGAIQSFVCLQSLADQKIHGNRNFTGGDNNCCLNYVKEKVRNVHMKYCISNTSGIGGCNATLVFQKYEE